MEKLILGNLIAEKCKLKKRKNEPPMITTNLFQDTSSHSIVETLGPFSILEYIRDLSVSPESAETAYFASMMETRKRQLIVALASSGVLVQAGAMQMTFGDVEIKTEVQGAGDFMKKFVGSRVTGETALKPHYVGSGIVVLEPTYRYLLLEEIDKWDGGVVIEDGMFLACQDTVKMGIVSRKSASSAFLGGEGLFNSILTGSGIAALESPVPRNELIEINLENDVVKIDGNMAIAWSPGLEFTVGKASGSFIGSMATGEGLVNIYRGTGRVLVAPVQSNRGISSPRTK